jgi:hypothetical protein
MADQPTPFQTILGFSYAIGYIICFVWLLISLRKDKDLTVFGRIFMSAIFAFFAPIMIPMWLGLLLLNLLVFKKEYLRDNLKFPATKSS